MNIYITSHKKEFDDTIQNFQQEIGRIRTGRAHASLIENLQIEAYSGMATPLIQLGTISVPEPMMMVFEPWDKSILKAVEKGIQISNVGISVVNEGSILRLHVPSLTQERRFELVKVLGQKLEESKQRIRQSRDTLRDEVMAAMKRKEITEDDKFLYLKEIDNFTADCNNTLESKAEKKAREITQV